MSHNGIYSFLDSTTVLLVIIVTALYWILNKYKSATKIEKGFWSSKGVAEITPEELSDEKFIGLRYEEIYNKLKQNGHKFGGTFDRVGPTFVPVDMTVVKNILIKDFEVFRNRGLQKVDEKNDPLTLQLFNLEDDKWKNLRNKLTPTFTTGKMKMMFPIFLDCAGQLTDVLHEHATNSSPIEIKELLACFSTDIITSCAFGIECNSIKNPNEPFRTYGRKILVTSPRKLMKLKLAKHVPDCLKKTLHLRFTENDVEKFFIGAVKQIVEYREKNNIFRPDFMHLLLQLKNRGKVTDDDKIMEGDKTQSLLSMNELAAQSFVFFTAGFETSSSTMMFGLYELARNQEVQNKLREEIRTVLANHDGKFSYDAIMEMIYLDQVVKETLRLYPSLSILARILNQDYTIPGTQIEIAKGTPVRIPAWAIQRDPDYFPNPGTFNPDHFSKENELNRPTMAWMPFGEGPRQCIGMRFGLMQTKLGLAAFVKDFRLTLNPRTPRKITLHSDILLTQTRDQIILDIKSV